MIPDIQGCLGEGTRGRRKRRRTGCKEEEKRVRVESSASRNRPSASRRGVVVGLSDFLSLFSASVRRSFDRVKQRKIMRNLSLLMYCLKEGSEKSQCVFQ
ncbi:hypothetical protein J6590_079372 [Homalodisca vitripennis]|nr:hypothetical protein J6590_079372 [Homalodisca vitripennis]